MRVLLCDDHVVFAESLAAVLTRVGLDIVGITYSPDEALLALDALRPDLCVLDVGFGEQTVLPRLAELRAAAPDTRLVLLSASLEPRIVTEALAAGVRGFGHKGHRVGEVVELLERVHAGEIAADRSLLIPPRPAREPERGAARLAPYLTGREREVLCRLVNGEDTRVLADSMGVTWATARSHVQSVLTKLGVHSRREAAAVAVRYGMVSGDTAEWRLPA